jgi:hypothetical protein
VRYVIHALIGIPLSVFACAIVAGLVKGYSDASKGIVEYDVQAMAGFQQTVTVVGAVVGAIAGLGIAAWKEKR